MTKNIDDLKEQITLTNNAAKRVNAILTGEGKEGYSLRVNVSGGGCSGMSYNLTFDNKEKEFDRDAIAKRVNDYIRPTDYDPLAEDTDSQI